MTEFLYRLLAIITSAVVFCTNLSPFAEKANKRTNYGECKNVILMIGDGMGFNSIKLAEQELSEKMTAFKRFTRYGQSKTSAATPILTTDSAAGGTALATGVRISLKTVGVYPSDIEAQRSYPMNLCELAVHQGKAAGIVTTAKTWDATPAAFSAHVAYRDYYEEIHRQQSESGLTLLWGERDSDLDLDLTRANGFKVLWNKEDLDNLDASQRSFGQFGYSFWKDGADKAQPTLAELTTRAVDILDNDDDGFFLMVEGAHIDKRSDKKDAEGMALALSSFNKAVNAALDYAEEHGDTMVVVTADHETGGIIKLGGEYVYTTTLHTQINVPLFVYGCNKFMWWGEIMENREVARRIACVMGDKNFPLEVTVKK